MSKEITDEEERIEQNKEKMSEELDWADDDEEEDEDEEEDDAGVEGGISGNADVKVEGTVKGVVESPAQESTDWADDHLEDEDEDEEDEDVTEFDGKDKGGIVGDSDRNKAGQSPAAWGTDSAMAMTSKVEALNIEGGQLDRDSRLKADGFDQAPYSAPPRSSMITQDILEQGPPFTVYISNFTPVGMDVIRNDISELLGNCQLDIRCSRDNKREGYAKAVFVDVSNEQSLEKALGLDGVPYNGQKLVAKMATSGGNRLSTNRRDGSKQGSNFPVQRDSFRRERSRQLDNYGNQRQGLDRSGSNLRGRRDFDGARRGFQNDRLASGGSGRFGKDSGKGKSQASDSFEISRGSSQTTKSTSQKKMQKDASVSTANPFDVLLGDEES